MSPTNKSTNSFKAGLNLSVDPINQPKDSYSYALNVVKEDPINNPDVLTNERGFTSYFDYGDPYSLIGSIWLGEEDYVLFVKAVPSITNPFNQIVLLQNKIQTVIYSTSNLNFSEQFPIKGTYRLNYRNERIIYWVDGNNVDRCMNVDNISLYTGNVDELSLDVKYLPAVLTSRKVNDDSGSLLTGTYEFFASYKTKDNAVSPWFILTASPVYVIKDNTQSSSPLDNIIVDGCDSGLPTNKAIQLNIANLDPRFTALRIGILKTTGLASTAYYVDNIYYSTSSLVYNYTGISSEILIPDIAELVVDPVKYYGSNSIIQMNNRLLRANTNSNKINIDYQSFANNIVVDYTVTEELVGTMPDSTDYNVRSNWWKSANTIYSDTKSLMRDEVYSVGVAFGLIKEGVESEVYHIPGRAINSIPSGYTYISQYDDVATLPYSSTWDTSNITENGVTIPQWKTINTAALSNDNAIKKCAYWESSEKYPSNLSLPTTGSSSVGVNNTNIRHHKMPSSGLEPIFRTTTVSGVISFYKRHLGLSFSNITVPDTIKNNIAYIRIYISPRVSDANKSIIAKGIFTNCSLTKINVGNLDTVSTTLYVKPCSPYNDLADIFNGDCYRDGQDDGWDTYNNFYHSFYSPDTSIRQPPINTDKILIENEMTGIAHYYNTAATHINVDPFQASGYSGGSGVDSSTNGGYKRDFFYDDSNGGATLPTGQTSTHSVYNITPGNFRSTYKAICILNGINKVSTNKSRRNLKAAVYVPFNAFLSVGQLGGMDNPYTSSFGAANVLLELNTTYPNLGVTETTDTSFHFTDNTVASNISDPAQASNITGTYHQHTVTNPLAVYRYGSLKKDNPSQYGTIEAIEYNPTDLVIASPTFDTTNTLIGSCSGLIGDCWIDMFSVKRTKSVQKEHYTFGGKPEISVGISTFFTESNINHRLRYAEGTDFKYYYPKQVLTTSIKQFLDAGFNLNILNADNYYKENVNFDKQVTKKNYGLGQLDALTFGVTAYPTRILYSDQLLNESIIDNYRVFLPNNYRDLPKDKGFICHLFKKGQELYAVTRDSLWRVFTSTENLQSNTNTIAIGTGEFLSLEPIELLSIEGGHGGSSSKSSLVECPYGYFYVDKNKGKLILFRDKQSYFDNSQQVDISLLGVFDFVRNNFKLIELGVTEFDSPLLNEGYIAGYDAELKRILVTKLDYQLTTTQSSRYRGTFDPTVTYTAGDIYLKNGTYYTFISTSSSYSTVSTSSNLSDFVQGALDPPTNAIITTPASHGVATASGGFITYTPTTGYSGTDVFNVTLNCTNTEVDVFVNPIPTDNFTVYAQYGMTIASVINGTTTGVPAGFTTISVAPGSSLSLPYTTVTSGIIDIRLIGTPSIIGHEQVYLEVAGSTVNTANIISGDHIYHLTLPSNVTNPTSIKIGIQTY